MRLQIKIILLLVPILAISVIANNLLMDSVLEYERVKSLNNEVLIVGNGARMEVDKLLKNGIMFRDIKAFEKICSDASSEYPDIFYTFVVDSNKTILYQSGSEKSSDLIEDELEIALKIRTDNVISYNIGGEICNAYVVQIFDRESGFENILVGSVVLCVPKEVLIKRMSQYKTYPIRLSISCFLFLLLSTFIAMSVWITKPLKKLDKAANEIAKNGIEKFRRVNITSNDEIGNLAASFNKMADDLQNTTVSKVYLDNIISSMTDAMIVTDSKCKIKTFNEAALNMLNYKKDELFDKSIGSMLAEPIEDLFDGSKFEKRIRNGEFKNYETMFCTSQKISIPVIFSCSVMLDAEGKLKNIVCTIKDITELKIAQESLKSQKERLERSNAELQEFAYVASHDLQEPLRKIMAFGDRLKDKCKDSLSEQGIDYLERMQNASKRMQVLINDLLKYSRINTRAQPFTEVDLNEVASEVINDLEIRIEQTGAKIEISKLPIIDAEPTQMRQLFQNIIVNGIKFHKENVVPEIKIHYHEIYEDQSIYCWEFTTIEFCEIIFEDNGIGIEEKYFDRIFGVFQRLHGRDVYEGTGVGLAICQKIAKRHGGSIRVESECGVGTKFIIRLPVKHNAAKQQGYNS